MSVFIMVLISLFQFSAYAQEESIPQTRLSSKGLAYVSLSTSPSSPVSGEPTLILINFIDPQTKAPRGDIYYNFIVRNETSQLFVVPGGSTINGKVGIPFQFYKPGNYQVEIELNDAPFSKHSTTPMDKVIFPLYVIKGGLISEDHTSLNTTIKNNPSIHINTSGTDNGHQWLDIGLVAVVASLGVIILRKKNVPKQRK